MGESADSGGGGNDEPQGTVFGVDGVSKTGSTSQDQQIGYTDGQGGKGANFDALQGATSQQTTAAVAAADAARNAGGGDTAAQQAVRGILDSYDPSAVSRQGNLTGSGQGLVNEAAQDALEFERVSRDQQAANLMGIMTSAPPVRTPANFDDTLNRFLDEDITSPALANIDVTQPTMSPEAFRAAEVAGVRAPPLIGLADPEAAALRSRVPDPNRPLTVAEEANLVKMFSERGLDPAAGQEDERQRQAQTLGITTLPEAATAAAVLQGNQPPTGTARIIRQKGPGGDTSSQQLFETLDPATQALIDQRLAREGAAGPPQFIETSRSPIRTISPNPLVDRGLESVSGYLDYPGTEQDREVYAPLIVAGTTMSPTQYADAQAFALAEPFMGMGAGDFNFGTGTTAPAYDFLARNPQPDAGGNLVNPLLQTGTAPMDVSGAASQFTDAMMTDSGVRGVGSMPMAPVQRDGQFTIGGVPVTEDLANMAIQMRGDIYDALPSPAAGVIDKGVSVFTGQDPVTRAATQYGEFLNLPGAMIDPDTGNISAPAGRGTLNLKNQGALAGTVTYSGVQDPNYSGPYANLVNPPAQTGDDEAMTTDVAKSPQDPCPPGYQLVNGVCQPVDDVTTAAPGSGFQFFPSGGFPTSFSPMTQATQVGQVNPFVLRPNVPQGIQGLSPTGAALGRQV